MKKTWRLLLVLVLVVSTVCLPALAATQTLDYVTDSAGLLTEKQRQKLNENGEKLSKKYDCGVYIITVDDITKHIDAPDIETAAETLYLQHEMGETDDQSGILLLLSMEGRDWAMFAFGYGNIAFTDYGKQYLSGSFLDDFREDQWYDGLKDYQKRCAEMIQRAQKGQPVDIHSRPVPSSVKIISIVCCVALGFAVAGTIMKVLKNQLKSVAKGTNADCFVDDSGLRLTKQYDTYVRTSTHRRYDPRSSSSSRGGSSGGGGTTIRSSGGSSASGKF